MCSTRLWLEETRGAEHERRRAELPATISPSLKSVSPLRMKNWRDLLKILRRSFLYLGGRTPQVLPSPTSHLSKVSAVHFPCQMLNVVFRKSQMDHSERYCYNPVLRWNPQVEEYFIKAYGAEHFSKISNALTCTLKTLLSSLSITVIWIASSCAWRCTIIILWGY